MGAGNLSRADWRVPGQVSAEDRAELTRAIARNLLGGLRADVLELRGVQVAVATRGAAFHRKTQVLARLSDVSQLQVGGAAPELEFMVVGVAIDLLGEQIPRSLEVAQPHGREAAIEEVECRVGLELCQLAPHSARFGRAPQPLERQSQVRQGLGVLGFALEDMAKGPLGLRPVAVAQVDDAER